MLIWSSCICHVPGFIFVLYKAYSHYKLNPGTCILGSGLCYGKLEAGILTFIIPTVLLGHLVLQLLQNDPFVFFIYAVHVNAVQTCLSV